MKENTNNIELLAQSGKSIFTTSDLAVIWSIPERRKLIELIKYYPRTSRLTSITKGVYAYGHSYTNLDIAQKLVPFSYISLYTSAQIHGLTFQHYDTTHAMALNTKKYLLPAGRFEYHRLKASAFYNPLGIIKNDHYLLAGPERTVADCLYTYPNFSFDNLRPIDPKKLNEIAKIYDNSSLLRRINKVIKQIKE